MARFAKSSLVLVAFAILAAIQPSAFADQTWYFSVSGGGTSGSGSITFESTGTPGIDLITGITGNFSDTMAGLLNSQITGTLPVDTSQSYFLSPTGAFAFNNLFYAAGNAPTVCYNGCSGGGQLDEFGLLFFVGGDEVNIFTNGNGAYTLLLANGAGAILDNQTVEFAATPEPGSFLLLGTGLLGLAVIVFRKARKPSLVAPL